MATNYKYLWQSWDLTYIPLLFWMVTIKPRVISIHDIQHKHYPENFKFWTKIYSYCILFKC